MSDKFILHFIQLFNDSAMLFRDKLNFISHLLCQNYNFSP